MGAMTKEEWVALDRDIRLGSDYRVRACVRSIVGPMPLPLTVLGFTLTRRIGARAEWANEVERVRSSIIHLLKNWDSVPRFVCPGEPGSEEVRDSKPLQEQ